MLRLSLSTATIHIGLWAQFVCNILSLHYSGSSGLCRIIGIIFHMIMVFKSSFVAVIVYDCLFTSPQGSKLQWIRIVTKKRHGTWAIKTGAVLVESAQLVDYVCVTFSAKLT